MKTKKRTTSSTRNKNRSKLELIWSILLSKISSKPNMGDLIHRTLKKAL